MLSNEIYLWYFSAEEITEDRYISWLSVDEVKRLNQYGLESKRQQCFISRVLVRYVMSQHFPDIKSWEWQFNYAKYGKPYLDKVHGLKDVYFNVSHSRNMYVVAIGGLQLGIDCEWLGNSFINRNVAACYLTAKEMKIIDLTSPLCKQKKLIEFWTQKEAISKAIGVGLNLDFKNICLARKFMSSVFSEGNRHINFQDFDLYAVCDLKEYIVCIAVNSFQQKIKQKIIMRNAILL